MTRRQGKSSGGGGEEVAVRALAFLAAEPDRLERFLALSGLDAGSIRKAAAEPGFLAAVMEHLLSDETLLLAFAANEGMTPESVVAAARRLGIVPWERGFA